VNESPVLDLGGKRALVTGGSRGVGRATALLLARAGADVAIAYRSRNDDAQAVVDTIRSQGRRALGFQGDLSIPGTAEALFHEAVTQFGGIDLVVGNHGIWPPDDVPLSEMEFEQWRRTLSVNLDSLFHLCREGARRISDDGRLVLVSSTAGQRGEAFHADYAASKGAVISLVKGLCVELAPRGVTVNAVAPGWIETDMTAEVLQGEAGNRVRSGIPLGRIATAEDVAGPIVFLCSSLARHVTGEVLNVNGGAVLPG